MDVFRLKRVAKNIFEYFKNINMESDVVLVSVCLNEFSFRTEEEKRDEIVVYLELFMCIEQGGEFLKYDYEELNKIIEKYEYSENLFFNKTENDEIKSMIKKYRNRVKEMEILDVTEEGRCLVYKVNKNNELELDYTKKTRALP